MDKVVRLEEAVELITNARCIYVSESSEDADAGVRHYAAMRTILLSGKAREVFSEMVQPPYSEKTFYALVGLYYSSPAEYDATVKRIHEEVSGEDCALSYNVNDFSLIKRCSAIFGSC